MPETYNPIMNRGWHLHGANRLFAHPGIQPDTQRGDISLTNNNLANLVTQLYDFQWLLYQFGIEAENELLAHCGKTIILTRETGIVGMGGDYEYILPNFQQPKQLVRDLLMRVYTEPTILQKPEPDLLYIKFNGLNAWDPNSGTAEFYDPLAHERRTMNVLQFIVYLEQQLNPIINPLFEAKIRAKTDNYRNTLALSYGDKEKLLRKYTSQAFLLANLFASAKIPFERLFAAVTHLDSFERAWQYFVLVVRENTLDVHDEILHQLYSPEALNQVWYDRRKTIDY